MNYKLGFITLILLITLSSTANASIVYTGTSFDTAGSGNTYPAGITMNDTYFWIVDWYNPEVYQYYHNGTYTGTHWDTTSSGNNNPHGITMNNTYIWIVDSSDDKVYQYYHNGTYTGTSFDTAGSGNTYPVGITMNNTYFWVTDMGDKVYQYYHNGTYTGTSFDTTPPMDWAKSITMDDTYFWIGDGVPRIYQCYHNGTYTGTIWEPTYTPIGITMNDTYFWITDDVDDEVYQYYDNTIPTAPTISSPSNNSYHTSQPITIQANSTDADGDSITYYFYGDTVDGSTLLDTSTNGTYVWHQALSGDYILKVRAHDGYEYGNYSNLIYFHSLIPPLLTTDYIANGSFENWSAGVTSAPDGWTGTGTRLATNYPARSTTYKIDNYSAALKWSGVGALYGYMYQSYADYNEFISKTLTVGMWVKGGSANSVWIELNDGSIIASSSKNIGTNWEWITCTGTVRASPSRLWIVIKTGDSVNECYVDGVILVEGAYPYISEPLNNSVHTFDFPPLLHDLTFVWQDSDADGYKYQIATDENFNLISEEGSLSTYTTDVSLTANDYYWRLFAYDPITDTYSDSSEVWQFTINETTISDGTAIDGVVYEITNAGSIAVEGALVNIWNTTWSDSMLVGQNGYYYFDGVDNSTYSLRATKTGYTDSAIELVTATSDATTTRNILLQSTSGAGQQYVDHYVKFIVKSWYGTLYSDVTVNVYLGDAIIPQHTDDTGTDGAVVFELNENQEYRITFIDAAQNIDEEKTLYPKESEYSIIVFGANLIPDEPASDDILYTVQGININSTHGFINVSFNDTSSTTTLAELWIKDKNNQSTLYHFNTTDSTKEWLQVVDGGNASYLIVFKIDNAILTDTLTITRTIYFDNDININLGLENNWSYILIAVIIISIPALLATKLNSEIMVVITVLIGWLMVFFGWLTAGMTIEEKITVGLMLLLATLVAFATMIKKGEK